MEIAEVIVKLIYFMIFRGHARLGAAIRRLSFVRKNKLRVFEPLMRMVPPGYQAACAVLFTSVHGPFPFCKPIHSWQE